jgi:hypothetical protein
MFILTAERSRLQAESDQAAMRCEGRRVILIFCMYATEQFIPLLVSFVKADINQIFVFNGHAKALPVSKANEEIKRDIFLESEASSHISRQLCPYCGWL